MGKIYTRFQTEASTKNPTIWDGTYLYSLYSAPSCDHFGHHVEYKKILVNKIAVKVTNLASCFQRSCVKLFPQNSPDFVR